MRAEIRNDNMQPQLLEDRLRDTLRDVLGLSDEIILEMNDQTELFGALPELDSMSVAALLTEIEDRFDIVIDDDEVDADMFETFGSLILFLRNKTGEGA